MFDRQRLSASGSGKDFGGGNPPQKLRALTPRVVWHLAFSLWPLALRQGWRQLTTVTLCADTIEERNVVQQVLQATVPLGGVHSAAEAHQLAADARRRAAWCDGLASAKRVPYPPTHAHAAYMRWAQARVQRRKRSHAALIRSHRRNFRRTCGRTSLTPTRVFKNCISFSNCVPTGR